MSSGLFGLKAGIDKKRIPEVRMHFRKRFAARTAGEAPLTEQKRHLPKRDATRKKVDPAEIIAELVNLTRTCASRAKSSR